MKPAIVRKRPVLLGYVAAIVTIVLLLQIAELLHR